MKDVWFLWPLTQIVLLELTDFICKGLAPAIDAGDWQRGDTPIHKEHVGHRAVYEKDRNADRIPGFFARRASLLTSPTRCAVSVAQAITMASSPR